MALILGALWAWDIYEKALCEIYARRYKTIPLPRSPSYRPSDVSIIVPTIDTSPTFTECARLWLASNPRELIIVTVPRCKKHVESLLEPVLCSKITILIAPFANKRQQIALGVRSATGKIIALVDDDAYWRETDTIIPYLLAPFENERVGSAAGLQSPEIHPTRQTAQKITPWETLAAYDMHKLNMEQPIRYTADGGCWALVGRTMFVRAPILRDPRFLDAFTHQVVNGVLVNGADDVYVTEWVLDHGWEICVQNAPEARVTADVKTDWRFLLQNLRWERGNFRSFSERVFGCPGFWDMWRRHPYLTRKMLEKLTRPIWTFAYLAAWLKTLHTNPWFALTFVLYIILGPQGWLPAYLSFLVSYPYMARQIWAVFVMERLAPLVDIYAFATMRDDRWLTRAADAQVVGGKGDCVEGGGKENVKVCCETIGEKKGRDVGEKLCAMAGFSRQEMSFDG